jgi:hypothetical protein
MSAVAARYPCLLTRKSFKINRAVKGSGNVSGVSLKLAQCSRVMCSHYFPDLCEKRQSSHRA